MPPSSFEGFSADELLQELRARESLEKGVGVFAAKSAALHPRVDLAAVDSATLASVLVGKQKLIYGTDDRLDLYEVADSEIRDDSDCVAALFRDSRVHDNGDGTSTLLIEEFGVSQNLCSSERFRTQPVGAFCTGFLVAPDVIATAGHCLNAGNLGTVRFVFGFRMTGPDAARTVLDNSEIYRGVAIIGWHLEAAGADWAVVRLDRVVPNHRVAPLRTTGAIAVGAQLHVIGHPVGLPLKYAPGAEVRKADHSDFFVANLDTYGGNSGSPVFSSDHHRVEGILVRGDTDFVSNGSCNVSLVCPATGCRGEDCTRITLLPAL